MPVSSALIGFAVYGFIIYGMPFIPTPTGGDEILYANPDDVFNYIE